MTDNRTTELRRLLDERGVEYEANRLDFDGGNYSIYTEWGDISYVEYADGTVLRIFDCTPEQAIAATLGDDDYECRMDELLCRLTNGKWSKSRSYSVDFMVSCVDEAYEDATLGNGTCENVAKNWGEFECSECGMYADFGSDLHRVSTCPDCGKAVER